MTPAVTLVVPCFNEARRWETQHFADISAIEGLRLLFVDDGSSDSTRRVIEEFTADGRASALYLPRNGGKAEAVRQGLVHALRESESRIVGFLDADGAFGIGDITRCMGVAQVKFAEGFEAVWSSRVALSGRAIERHPSRHYIGRAVATVLSLAYPALPYDSQSGFKMFARTPNLEVILRMPFETRWVFEVEMLLRWQASTGAPMQVWEEPVMQWRDVPGSKIRGAETLRISRELGRVLMIARRGRA